MLLQKLTTQYENEVYAAKQKVLAGLAEFLGAKSIKFVGYSNYNGEEYYDELGEIEIDGQSICADYQNICEVATKLGLEIKEKLDSKYPNYSAYHAFAELRDFLTKNLPDFINREEIIYETI